MTTKWNGVLWTANNQRALPTCAAFDATLRDGGGGDDIFTACRENPLGVALYHIPTIEWIDGLAAWIRARGARRVLEIGAGDGFVSHLLRERLANVKVIAQDNRSWPTTRTLYPPVVEAGDLEDCTLGCVETARLFRPDLILWVWAPMGTCGAALLPHCDDYLLVGEGQDGCTGGFPGDREPLQNAALEVLDNFARCRTDYYDMLHTVHYLYAGTAQR